MEDKCLLDVQHSYVESLAIPDHLLTAEQDEEEQQLVGWLMEKMGDDYGRWHRRFRTLRWGLHP